MRPSPFRDPLLLKELLGSSRRTQTYWGRALYVAVIGLIIYEFWTTMTTRLGLLSPSAFAELSRGLFDTFIAFQMVMVSLAAIGGAAERFIREDRNKTLGLLMLTPLTPGNIVFAKWRASVIQAGSLILCGVPVVAVCVYLGGIGLGELLWSTSLTVALAALGAAFGLRASAIYSSVPRAVIMAVLYSIGYLLLPVPLMIVTLGFGAVLVPYIHPVYSAFVAGSRMGMAGGMWEYSWVTATLASFFVSWLVLRKLAGRVRGLVVAPTPTPANFVHEQRNLVGRFRVALNVGDRPSRSYREVWESDPLLWKELLTHASGRWSREKVLGYGISAALFMLLLWSFTQGESRETFIFLGCFYTLLTIANGASLFAPEKEGRRMDMLLSCPVSTGALVRSKLLSGLLAPVSVRVTLLGLATVLAFSWWSGVLGVLIHLVVFVGFLLAVFLMASTASLHAATTQGAALAALGAICLILLVLPIVVSIAVPAGFGDVTGPLALLSALNPVWVLAPLRRSGDLDPGAALGRCSLFVLCYGGAAFGLIGWIRWRFDRVMGRA